MMWIRIQIRTEPQYGRPPGFGSDGANPDPYSGGKKPKISKNVPEKVLKTQNK